MGDAMSRLARFVAYLISAFWPLAGGAAGATSTANVQTILERFATDYAADPSLQEPTRFGVIVDGVKWHIAAMPAEKGGKAAVTLRRGFPDRPAIYISMSQKTLARLDAGLVNALTAGARARENDKADLDFGVMDGFQGEPDFGAFVQTLFHFFTRGLPETIPFGPELARPVHGAHAVVFFYQPGLRSAWFDIHPGDHANADPADQANPFPSLFVCTEGRGKARIGGVEIEIGKGQAVFIPANTSHEFWNDGAQSVQGVLIMFGSGA